MLGSRAQILKETFLDSMFYLLGMNLKAMRNVVGAVTLLRMKHARKCSSNITDLETITYNNFSTTRQISSMATLTFPDVTVIRDGDFLNNFNLKFVRVLAKKKNSLVLEASMKNDDSIRKAIKKIPYLDSKGRHRGLEDSTEELTIMHNVQHPHLMKMDWVVTDLWMDCVSRSNGTKWNGFSYKPPVPFDISTTSAVYTGTRVKPDNIFQDASGNAILGDFGCSQILPDGENTVSRWRGTLGYHGPEFFLGYKFDPFLMDAYALGATLWSLVFRLKPADLDLLDVVRNSSLPEMYR
ncbi:probable receptor-like protein kinase At5g20050 [Aplysia californica]|uniref:Probable receptor-like protein kinase At5g20050 n=1 Tax=Aplysia californica TaxID=6500 RepID=A0ABM0JLD2_APLCA|nr:probable receptor-like protein kinase At5g20050 [Aplysia californica]